MKSILVYGSGRKAGGTAKAGYRKEVDRTQFSAILGSTRILKKVLDM